MGYRLGSEGKLYYGTAGSVPSTEISGVTTVKVTSTRSQAKIQTRSSDVDGVLLGSKQVTVDITMPWNSADTGMVALRNAHKNNTDIALKALDVAGGLGAQGDFKIADFSHDQPLGEGQTVTVQALPSANAVLPVTLI
jgi:hypothetical protein